MNHEYQMARTRNVSTKLAEIARRAGALNAVMARAHNLRCGCTPGSHFEMASYPGQE